MTEPHHVSPLRHTWRHFHERWHYLASCISTTLFWIAYITHSRALLFGLLAIISASCLAGMWHAVAKARADAHACDECRKRSESLPKVDTDAIFLKWQERMSIETAFVNAPTPENAQRLHEILLSERLDREELLKRFGASAGVDYPPTRTE